MFRRINIINSSHAAEEFPSLGTVEENEVNDTFIHEIVSLPEDDIIIIQICDYISAKTLRKLNGLFLQRPDITFRVYGGEGREAYDGWDLSFLSLIPDVSRLILNCFRALNTDFSLLCGLKNLRSLELAAYDIKDYSFLQDLPDQLECLLIDAEMKTGKAKIDCRWLLRYSSLHTLFLGRIEKNLDCIADLINLRKLTLRGGASDLSFLKNMDLKDLTISWCAATKIDWDSLHDLSSLQSLTLFGVKKLEDISFISTLRNLETLKLERMGSVVRMPDLSGMKKLRAVDLDCNNLTDVSGLLGVASLENVRISSNSLPEYAAESLLSNLSIKHLSCFGKKFRLMVDR